MRFILLCFFTIIVVQSKDLVTLVTNAPFFQAYNTTSSNPNQPSWYINDHTVVMGPGNVWHMFGITHTEPADPIFEVNMAHATSTQLAGQNSFSLAPYAMGAVAPETHLWAPHVIYVNGLYYNFYCGGGADRTQALLQLATSKDLWTWTRVKTLFTGGIDGRDPMVMNLGPEYNNQWIIYYCGTDPDLLVPSVTHVTYYRTSSDLLNWSQPGIAFKGRISSPSGGPTESPFVIRRGSNFYLFSGTWVGYSDTRVFLSKNPYQFGSAIDGTAVQVGEIPSHAPEVIRDVNGDWYISRAGWGQGGLYFSKITWSDGLDAQPTSMPPPISPPAIPPQFNSNIGSWVASPPDSVWAQTPEGLQGFYPLDNAFYISGSRVANFTFEADIQLISSDGNPTSNNGPWTRVGSAAALIFRCQQQNNPLAGTYALNFFTDYSGNGGIKLFKFPYNEIIQVYETIPTTTQYHLKVVVQGNIFNAYFNPTGSPQKLVITNVVDNSFTSGFVGLNVWQASAFFNNVRLSPI